MSPNELIPTTIVDSLNGVARETTAERTSLQVYAVPGPLSQPYLPRRRETTESAYRVYREMRKDPTISLARRLLISPLVAAGWSYEPADDAPDEAADWIRDMFEPLRLDLMRTALEGNFDYGHQSYEKIFGVDDEGCQCLARLKPLIQSHTQILVHPETGAFWGLQQVKRGAYVNLDADQCLHIALEVEGTDWYGKARLENARLPYESWNDIEEGAGRYGRKVAGSHWVVTYPVGTSPIEGEGEVDNFEISKRVIRALQSSGAVSVPRSLKPYSEDVSEGAEPVWKIELISDEGQGGMFFNERQAYLDALKVRGCGLPERSVLEGQFGTKAEAEAHSDFAITAMELDAQLCCQAINQGAVNHVMRLRYGPRSKDKVRIEPSPLSDDKREYLQTLYAGLLSQPDGALIESDNIDLRAVRDRLGIPSKSEAELLGAVQPGAALFTQQEIQSMLGAAGYDLPGNTAVGEPAA